MSTSINQIRSQMNQILTLRDNYIESAIQSDEKLSNMIETARKFHAGMKPMNEDVEQLQTRIKNIEFCINGLSHVQDFYKTGEEVKRIIYEGPQSSLDNYLSAMDRIRDSLTYFDQNNTQHVEYSHLSALFSNGLKALQKHLDEILKTTFSPIPAEKLYQTVLSQPTLPMKPDLEKSSLQLEEIASDSVKQLRQLSSWLRKVNSSSLTDQRFQITGASILPESLNHYCDFRRDLMRISLKKLSEYKMNVDKTVQSDRARMTVNSKGSDLGIPVRTQTSSKSVGLVRDAIVVRQESESFDVEQFLTKLSAFFILIENERIMLQHLSLVSNSHEIELAHEAICKGAANEFYNDGNLLIRLVNKGSSHGEVSVVLAILVVLKFFVENSNTIVYIVKIVPSLTKPFNDLVNRLRLQSKHTLDYFIQQLSPNVGTSLVPPDSTVHELASIALLFLEKLMDFEFIVDIILMWDEGNLSPNASLEHLLSFGGTALSQNVAFGNFIFSVVAAIIVNIDKKSESYAEELQKLVFQMNNLRYILKNLSSTGLQDILMKYDNTAIAKFSSLLEERKVFYIKRSVAFQLGQRKQIDSRERAQMKEIWSNFNASFSSFIKQHAQLSIPDKELRENLRSSACSQLVPAFAAFRDVSMSIAFTSRREKYIRFTPEEFKAKLEQLYISGASALS